MQGQAWKEGGCSHVASIVGGLAGPDQWLKKEHREGHSLLCPQSPTEGDRKAALHPRPAGGSQEDPHSLWGGASLWRHKVFKASGTDGGAGHGQEGSIFLDLGPPSFMCTCVSVCV